MRLKLYKLIQKYFSRFTSPQFFSDLLRIEGFEIGEGTIFYSPNTISVDRERPWMLKIGKYCRITKGCIILTHDYSRSVLRRKYGELIGEAGETIIGDNVFIGMNSIILMGAKIGSNVIVGAGSVVSGKIPDNVVVAGNPARVIRTLDEHYERRKAKTLNEAKLYFTSYKNRYGCYPAETSRNPFFWLYTDRNKNNCESDSRFILNGDNSKDVIADFLKTEPQFTSYDEFIKYVSNE